MDPGRWFGAVASVGLNGKSDYTAGFGRPGDKFSYPVEARFEAKRGAGIRTQTRTCRFTFAKH